MKLTRRGPRDCACSSIRVGLFEFPPKNDVPSAERVWNFCNVQVKCFLSCSVNNPFCIFTWIRHGFIRIDRIVTIGEMFIVTAPRLHLSFLLQSWCKNLTPSIWYFYVLYHFFCTFSSVHWLVTLQVVIVISLVRCRNINEVIKQCN